MIRTRIVRTHKDYRTVAEINEQGQIVAWLGTITRSVDMPGHWVAFASLPRGDLKIAKKDRLQDAQRWIEDCAQEARSR